MAPTPFEHGLALAWSDGALSRDGALMLEMLQKQLGLSDKERAIYRRNLLSWLRPGGQLILVHFNKLHFLDWRPMGPKRWPSERVKSFLGTEFRTQDYHEEVAKVAFPIGPNVKISTYWFERT